MESQEAQAKPKLVYWNIRGYATFIKLAFEASGVHDYEVVNYEEVSENDWFLRDKPALTMTLPNLPYLKDGDVEISEHEVIFRHILRKYKPELLGVTLTEQAEVDQFISFWMKTNNTIRDFCYSATDIGDEARRALLKPLLAPLGRVDARLSTRKFHLGDNLTGADLYMWEAYEMLKVFHAEIAGSFENIKRVAASIEEF